LGEEKKESGQDKKKLTSKDTAIRAKIRLKKGLERKLRAGQGRENKTSKRIEE